MKSVFILVTQWKDRDPEIEGVFSSFGRAVAHFVREEFGAADPSEVAQVALKMAHRTDDEDFADFGDTRAWIEEREVDECCEERERGDGDDGK